jgi:hypothetical protein
MTVVGGVGRGDEPADGTGGSVDTVTGILVNQMTRRKLGKQNVCTANRN